MATHQPIIGYLFQVIFYHQPQKNFSLLIKSKKAADDQVNYLRNKITRVLADYLYLGHQPLASNHPNRQYIPDHPNPRGPTKTILEPYNLLHPTTHPTS